MFLLAADLAVFRRLTGAPLDNQGKPVLGADGIPTNRWLPGPPEINGVKQPSYGLRLPVLKSPHDTSHGLTSKDPDAYRPYELGFDPAGFRQVPVFDENVENRKWADIWPCVTFSLQDMSPNTTTAVYGDPFVYEDTTTALVDAVDGEGNVIKSGREGLLVQPHPESWDLVFAIRIYSKSSIEFKLLCSQLLQLFPARSSIEIDFMDGSVHCCDMFQTWSQNLDLRGENIKKSMDPTEQAHYSRAFFYKIEGYLDNFGNRFGSNDILKMNAIQGILFSLCKARDAGLDPADPVLETISW